MEKKTFMIYPRFLVPFLADFETADFAQEGNFEKSDFATFLVGFFLVFLITFCFLSFITHEI